MCHLKKSVLLKIILVLIVSVSAFGQYSGGTGEPDDPYQIATAADLILLGETPEDYGTHFILTSDIDLDPNLLGGKVFDRAVIAPDVRDTESGFQGAPFTGIFDGGGRTIANLTIVAGDSQPGLFGWLDVGTRVTNLRIVDADIVRLEMGVAGMLAACNDGLVANCYASGRVSGHIEVGGMVGSNSGSIICCYTAGSVDAIKGIGGLVGRNRGRVDNSYSTASVSGRVLVAGLVGDNDTGGFVSNSYSIGVVSDTPLDVSPDEPQGMGGLVGRNRGHVVTSFWDVTTSGLEESDGGTGLTTADMQKTSTFLDAGWDFVDEIENGPNDIWKIVEGQAYPLLSWQKYGGGTGEPNDPYLIYTAEHLNELGAERNDYDKHFRLMADIDLSAYTYDRAVISPDMNDSGLQHEGKPFTGVLDGNGHTISNLTIEGHSFLGLFGYLDSEAIVFNLSLQAVHVNGVSDFVGSLAGFSYGTIDRCYCTGEVTGNNLVGGLVGSNSIAGKVANCYGTVDVSGNEKVGGLVGYTRGSATMCFSAGRVIGEGQNTGGLVGERDSSYGTVADCFWDTQTSGLAVSAGGMGKTTAEMQTVTPFLDAGWDFLCETINGLDDIWTMPENDYPRLAWELDAVPPCSVTAIELSNRNLHIMNQGVVLVDFYATWCSFCQQQAPIMDDVANQVQGHATVAKLNIDEMRESAEQYNVTAIPTLIIFKDGQEVYRKVGLTQAFELVEAVKRVLNEQDLVL